MRTCSLVPLAFLLLQMKSSSSIVFVGIFCADPVKTGSKNTLAKETPGFNFGHWTRKRLREITYQTFNSNIRAAMATAIATDV